MGFKPIYENIFYFFSANIGVVTNIPQVFLVHVNIAYLRHAKGSGGGVTNI